MNELHFDLTLIVFSQFILHFYTFCTLWAEYQRL